MAHKFKKYKITANDCDLMFGDLKNIITNIEIIKLFAVHVLFNKPNITA